MGRKKLHITKPLKNSTQHSPTGEANSSSASQEIPRVLWKQKVHYRIHNSPPLAPILSHKNYLHAISSHVMKFHFYISIPFMPMSPKWSYVFRLPHQNTPCIAPLSNTHSKPRSTRPLRSYRPAKAW
jgi:hypothetical protein